MLDAAKKEEEKKFSYVKNKISEWILQLTSDIEKFSENIQALQSYYIESFNEIDNAEKGSVQQSIDIACTSQNHAIERRKRAEKILLSPYFGRVDFEQHEDTKIIRAYIGLSDFDYSGSHLVYDWRAPISSLFYNFDAGEASYLAPSGLKEGSISLKRQYRIRNGQMEYMFDSSVKIDDEILQEELSRTSSEKMKNIIVTIQREQNEIIRDESSDIMIIQGVAGSGKTSIALHRVAYFLYRFKDDLTATDVLILSPNKVFAHYISNVLPELGEENLPEIEMEELAKDLIDGEYEVKTFYQQIDNFISAQQSFEAEYVQYKSSFEFAKKLEEFVRMIKNSSFTPAEVIVEGLTISCDYVNRRSRKVIGKTTDERVDSLAYDLVAEFEYQYRVRFKSKQKREVHQQVASMYRNMEPYAIYLDFFTWLERQDMAPKSKKCLNYEDVFPLLYIKSQLGRLETSYKPKYLIVDEMQDYSPVQYMLLKQIFKCKMALLGDSNQSINPYSSTNKDIISSIFVGADIVELHKSYRSTKEIMSFAQKIIYNEKLVMLERHGEAPRVVKTKNKDEMLDQIFDALVVFKESSYNSLGIICKTQVQADLFYKQINALNVRATLMYAKSNFFSSGIIIAPCTLAKGLEFDSVIIPDVDALNYSTAIDRHLLYVACTRALHKLDLFYYGRESSFL